mgnify:CR=1 FL=1
MSEMLAKAHRAMEEPEVQEMLQKLSAYGLGIFMPHQHDEQTGDYRPLPSGKVAVERNLQVTFEDASSGVMETCSAVGWQWDGDVKAAAACVYCMDVQQGHAKFPH